MNGLSLDEWARVLACNPREEGEAPSDWMARVYAIVAARAPKPDAERLPYREPGEDDAA